MQCMARGEGLGVMGGVCFEFQVWGPTLSSQEKEGGGSGSTPARRSPIQLGSLFHEHTGPYHPLRKKQSDSVHVLLQSHVLPWPTKCCNSPLLAPNHSTITKHGPQILSCYMCQETPGKSRGHKVGQDGNSFMLLTMNSPLTFLFSKAGQGAIIQAEQLS